MKPTGSKPALRWFGSVEKSEQPVKRCLDRPRERTAARTQSRHQVYYQANDAPTSPAMDPSSLAGRGKKGMLRDFSAIMVVCACTLRALGALNAKGTKAAALPSTQARDRSFMMD